MLCQDSASKLQQRGQTLPFGKKPSSTYKEQSQESYFMGPDVLNKSFFPELIKHLLPCPVKLLTSATKSSGKGSGRSWI